MIEVRHLTKTFDAFTAVNDISFDVKPGEVLGFLGPNGAGKSTTMKMLTGFLEPSYGDVIIAGHDIQTDPKLAQQHIGYLPEGAPLYGDMTVVAFLRFIAEIRGFSGSAIADAVEEVIARLELDSVVRNRIHTLSKGYKRRVGIAQAIIHNPKILILDEPTDGLDPNQKHQVRELIRNLSKDKIVIISTHILEEVSAVCTRALIIAQGKIVFDGTPIELEKRSRYYKAISVRFTESVALASNILTIEGVNDVETSEDGRTILILPEPGVNLIHILLDKIQAEQWPIDDLTVEHGRLDDVFRTITQKEV